MRPAPPAAARAAWAVAARVRTTASSCPHPRITVKFRDWLQVKEIKVKSVQISNYSYPMKLIRSYFRPPVLPTPPPKMPSAYADRRAGAFGAEALGGGGRKAESRVRRLGAQLSARADLWPLTLQLLSLKKVAHGATENAGLRFSQQLLHRRG